MILQVSPLFQKDRTFSLHPMVDGTCILAFASSPWAQFLGQNEELSCKTYTCGTKIPCLVPQRTIVFSGCWCLVVSTHFSCNDLDSSLIQLKQPRKDGCSCVVCSVLSLGWIFFTRFSLSCFRCQVVVDGCVWIIKEHQIFVTKADFFCEEHSVLMNCLCLSEPCKRGSTMDL